MTVDISSMPETHSSNPSLSITEEQAEQSQSSPINMTKNNPLSASTLQSLIENNE